MIYRLNDEFTKIDQVDGLMQNMTHQTDIEVVACVDNPQKDSGILLLPLEKLKFTTKTGENIFARCARIDGTIANLSVVNFKAPVSDGSGTGCDCKNSIDDTVVVLDKTWSSEKINDTFTKYYTKTEIDNLIGNDTGGSAGDYTQVTKIGVTAPKTYILPILSTNTFKLPPIEVLKFKAGSKGQIKTVCEFDQTDAEDFAVGGVSGEAAKYVTFDGVMKFNLTEQINTNDSSLESKFISESDIISTSDYKKINKIEISGIEGELEPIPGAYTDYILSSCTSILNATKIADNHWNVQNYACFKLGALSTNRSVVEFKFAAGTNLNKTASIMLVRAGNSLRNDTNINIKNINVGSTYTVIFDAINQYAEVLENGLRMKKSDCVVGFSTTTSSANIINNWYVALFGAGTFVFDKFRYILNLPNNTAMKYKYNLYKKYNEAYGMVNGVLVKITDQYDSLSSTSKINLFQSTNGDFPLLSDLIALDDFKILTLSARNNKINLELDIVPQDQLILPKGLISTQSFENIESVTVTAATSANGVCKLLVTTDNVIYQTYNFATQLWQVIDHSDLAIVKSSGIDAAQLANIGNVAWEQLTAGETGIGFAYMISIEDTTDRCEVDKLELQVNMKGCWKKAMHGTDYDYEYPSNNELNVNLLNSGDYKINYCKG